MLPPDWNLTRDQVASMSYDDLSKFDVDNFMQSYREKMTKVNVLKFDKKKILILFSSNVDR